MIKTEYKKGGRPTKGVAEKKKYRITVRLNTQDYYTLKGKAKSAGVTMSEFVRQVLDKGNVIEGLTVEQADFIRKLCGMANNLNQLAHRANAEGFYGLPIIHDDEQEKESAEYRTAETGLFDTQFCNEYS